MKFVILHRKQIPGYSICGPILTPMEYDIHQVLRWVAAGVDIREVMEDGSYRKLAFNDKRLMEELNKKLSKQMELKNQRKVELERPDGGNGNVRLLPEKKKHHTPKVKPQPKVEPKKEEPEVEVKKEEPKQPDLIIDELERPE
jgi:hypothetical protein